MKELPAGPEPEFVELREVLSTTDIAQVALAKSLLEGEKIPCYVQNERISTIYMRMPVRIMVPKKDLKKAEEIMKGFL